MSNYRVEKTQFDNFHVIHKPTKVVVAVIEPISKPIRSLLGVKYRTDYHVKNQVGVSPEPFKTVKAAAHHSIETHERHKDTPPPHPMHGVGAALQAVTHAIQQAAKDPRMNDHTSQHGLLQISKRHADAVQAYKNHTET